MITGRQLREARKLLLWGPDRLAKRARIAVGLVVQAERQGGVASVTAGVARSLRQVLEQEGLEFSDDPVAPVRWRRDRSSGGLSAAP